MENKSNVCFCLHGAAQRIINPKVRSLLRLSGDIPQSIHDQLILIKGSLTKETWTRGSYFTPNYSGNVLSPNYIGLLNNAARNCDPGARAQHASELRKKLTGSDKTGTFEDIFSLWKSRDADDYQNNIHYLMGLFGLSIALNDHCDTTLDMIHQRLDQVIMFAKEYNL